MFQESGSIGSLRGYNLFEGKPVPYTILVKGKQEPKEKVWVGTLVNKNLPSKIVFKDQYVLIVQINVNKEIINVVNVYARPDIRKNVWDLVEVQVGLLPKEEKVVVGGDFNGQLPKLANYNFANLTRIDSTLTFRHKVTKALSSIDHMFSNMMPEGVVDAENIGQWNWALSDHKPVTADFGLGIEIQKQ